MKLSVIIVNYNVKYFLEQCLHSVIKAIEHIEAEVFVVDNNSVDGSCLMVSEKFPSVILIENKINTGFAVANNQAIKLSKGEYVLLLNPDTMVEEDTFTKVIGFMDEHPDAGGLGVKMIDGKGTFLPESKRGFPSPMVAFYKIFGLSRLFPKSKRFNHYHLGYLDKNQVHEIEVLAGAFMLMRRQTLDKVGLLDEDYFMYGEDIDLSYRIIKGGYKNYYYPHTAIIHYKGESTKKGSVNYVKMFYNAMAIFAKKHLSQKNARIFSAIINFAIYFRAFLALMNRFAKKMFLPLVDATLLYGGFVFLASKWGTARFDGPGHFPVEFFTIALPVYVLVWLISIFYSGGYENKVKPFTIPRAIFLGAFVILIGYALLPEHFRFSRAVILMGTVWGFVALNLYRILIHLIRPGLFQFDFGKKVSIAIVGNSTEENRVIDVLNQSSLKYQYMGLISPVETDVTHEFIGHIGQIDEIIKINKIDELIFCSANLTAQQIIAQMLRLEGSQVHFKIAPPESLSIIGSNSIDTAGDLYVVDFNTIVKPANIRNKRLFDVLSSVILLAIFPFMAFVAKPAGSFLINIFKVLVGSRTWIGFMPHNDINPLELPKIKKGIISQAFIQLGAKASPQTIQKTNLAYAKDYQMYNDLLLLLKGIRHLGRKN